MQNGLPQRGYISVEELKQHLESQDVEGLHQIVDQYDQEVEPSPSVSQSQKSDSADELAHNNNGENEAVSLAMNQSSAEELKVENNDQDNSSEASVMGYNPFNEINRLIRSLTPNRVNNDRIQGGGDRGQRYTMGNNRRPAVSDSESESEGTTIRFERTIRVSIDAPNADLLTEDQFQQLERIFEQAFNFSQFMSNFLQNFSQIDQILGDGLQGMTIQNGDPAQIVPTQEAIDALPEVEISRQH
jgi:hypothetical protein